MSDLDMNSPEEEVIVPAQGKIGRDSIDVLRAFVNDGVPVVDSRLIATELDINHRSFLSTIERYQEVIEENFGKLIYVEEKTASKGRSQVFIYLTEPQATFIMTLSSNTDQVITCKVKLVLAFCEVREQLTLEKQKRWELEQKLLLQQGIQYTMYKRFGGKDTLEDFIEREKAVQNVHREAGTIEKYFSVHPERDFDSPTFDLYTYISSWTEKQMLTPN